MLNTFYPAGSTSVSVYLRAFTASTGLPKTDVVFNTSGIAAAYIRDKSASTSITLVTQTASGAYSSGGFVHVAGGVYRLDVPNAALTSGVDYVSIVVSGVTDCVFTTIVVDLRPRQVNVTQWSGTNVPTPNTAGYPIVTIKSGTATGELNITTGTVAASVAGTVAANVTQWNGSAVPTPNVAGHPIVTIRSGTATGELSITSGVVAASVSGTVAANVTQFGGTSITSVAELTAPPAVNNASLLDQIRYTYHVLRNKQEVTASTRIIRRNDGTTAMASSSLTDNGTTLTVNAAT